MSTQPPVAGSRRHANMVTVRQALARHANGLRYDTLSTLTGLSAAAVGRACNDLRYHDASVTVGIPAYANDWKVVLRWRPASRRGEASQAAHNATRLGREATRLETAAREVADPGEALAFGAAARHLRATAEDLAALAQSMNR